MIGHGVEMLLLSTAAGYWVLERAEAHKGQLKKVGLFLGSVIIVVSLVGIVCRVWYLASAATCSDSMNKTGRGWCPFMSKAPSSAPNAQ